jgi:hypothetical protein
MQGHLDGANRGGNTYKDRWIRSMLNKGLLPTITLLGIYEGNGSKEEISWIKRFRDGGVKLTNGTDGGDGGILTKASCRKISKALTGRKHTPEQIEKQRKAITGRHHTLEARARMKEGKKGWRCTWGDKISKTLMGHPGASKGEHRPPITVLRLKEAWIKRKASGWVSPNRNKIRTPIQREHYRLAWIKRKQNKKRNS